MKQSEQTKQSKIIKVNYFDPQSRSQVLPKKPLISSRGLNWKGCNFDYFDYDAHEAPTHVGEHHVVSIVY